MWKVKCGENFRGLKSPNILCMERVAVKVKKDAKFFGGMACAKRCIVL